MHPSLEHVDACLPVTALKLFSSGDASYILQGQGPFARVVDEDTGKSLAKLRTFRRNNVHGFVILSQIQQNIEKGHVQIITWGGDSVRLLDVLYSRNDLSGEPEVAIHAASAEYLAPDWILAGCAPESGAGTNHAYVVTAHNAVLGLQVMTETSSKYARSIHIKPLVAGVKSLLYSADTVVLSESQVLVAVGTVFGEVIVWSCFLGESDDSTSKPVGSIHHFFTGHEGSVFGVRISPTITSLPGRPIARFLASCSDDRTVRLWDISDCEHVSRNDPSPYSTDGFELRSTGFGLASAGNDDALGSEAWVARGYAHKARIWNVHFLHTHAGHHNNMNLVSYGEDASCVVWGLSWDSAMPPNTTLTLRELASYHLHTGKHIWSLATRATESGNIIYTGGADGALKSFRIEVDESGATIFPNRTNIITASIDEQGIELDVDDSIKRFAFVAPDRFIATTRQGEVQNCRLVPDDPVKPYMYKETLSVQEDLRSFCVMSRFPQPGLVLLAGPKGLIRLYNDRTGELSEIANVGRLPQELIALDCELNVYGSPKTLHFIASYMKAFTAELFTVAVSQYTAPDVHITPIALPEHKRWSLTCASLIYDNQYLALGFALGYVGIYPVVKSDAPQQSLWGRKVHLKESVTQIMPGSLFVDKPGTLSTYFMTCGRDGKYFIHEILTGDSISFRTIHCSVPSIPIAIEGVYIDNVSRDIVIYGFSSTGFIVWNETEQSEVARIDCGGSHRHWDFQPSDENAGSGYFAWIKNQLNIVPIQGDVIRPLRAGGHGREIKATGASPVSTEFGSAFVTGSEDTVLRLSTPVRSEGLSTKCLRVIKQHRSGVQEVSWSKDGRFFFTSGGMEEFYVWKVRSIPHFGVAANLEASCPTEEPESELRVTSFDVLDVEGEQSEGGFLFCLTYSNSKPKVFHYSSSPTGGEFTLVARGTYTSNCLTQVRFVLRGSSIGLVTASTDGYFTFWNLTPVIEPHFAISDGLRLKQPIMATPELTDNITCENRFRIHSNSIKCLEITEISSSISLVVAGGDDNALTFSLLTTSFANADITHDAYTLTIPDAHAACISTLKILQRRLVESSGALQLTIASSGNDHRVKIWRVEVDPSLTGSDGIQVTNTINKYTAVADISSLDMIRVESGSAELVVCGVGTEMFQITLH